MVKWVVKLSKHDITFKLRSLIKAQALANFTPAGDKPFTVEISTVLKDNTQSWILPVDGASNHNGSILRIVLSPLGEVLERAVKCDLRMTNNEGEYEALILGL